MNAFSEWCNARGITPLPIAPLLLAQFVRDVTPTMVIEEVWPIVREVSEKHSALGLADPAMSPAVNEALSVLGEMTPPRSWTKELKRRFPQLPYDVQAEIARHEKACETEIRRMQNELAGIKKEIAARADSVIADRIECFDRRLCSRVEETDAGSTAAGAPV